MDDMTTNSQDEKTKEEKELEHQTTIVDLQKSLEYALTSKKLQDIKNENDLAAASTQKELDAISNEKKLVEAKLGLEKSKNPDKYAGVKTALSDLAAQYKAAEEKGFTYDVNADYVSELAAYKIMSKLADDIGDKICKDMLKLDIQPKEIMIVDTLDFINQNAQLMQIKYQIKHWENTLHNHNEHLKAKTEGEEPKQKDDTSKKDDANQKDNRTDAIEKSSDNKTERLPQSLVGTIPTAVGGLLNTIAGIVPHFQSEYDVKASSAFTLSEIALKAKVCAKIINFEKSQDISVNILGLQHTAETELESSLRKCIKSCSDVDISISNIKSQITDELEKAIEKIDSENTDLTKELAKQYDQDKVAEIKRKMEENNSNLALKKNEKSQMESEIKNSENLVKNFNDFFELITTIPEGKEKAPLTLCLIQDQINNLKTSHLLYMKVISNDGMSIKAKNLFRSYLRFSGGCVLSYFVVSTTGELISSDTKYGMDSIKFRMHKNDSFKINCL